jgi:DNA helicase-2/ATP-dependent DNA helicase PcrA
MSLFDSLNEAQRAAAQAGDGPVMIVAGPGTGKTKTLTSRIAHLLESGRSADQILALTFTKKSAEEMKTRVAALGLKAQPTITTFHALCHQIIGGEAPFVSDAVRLQIIKSLPRPKTLKDISARELGLLVSRTKNTPTAAEPDLAKVVRAYNQALQNQGLRDFDDLLVQAHQLLQAGTAATRYDYILVDEFQDTNLLQYEILKLLLGSRNIFVIGDPNQSIYGFRGASGTIFEQFAKDFSGCKQVHLTINYRSAPQIVRLANALFETAPDLQASSQGFGTVRAVETLNEYGEAEWVLGHIQRAIGGGDFLKAVSDDHRADHRRLSDFAVLYRSRSAALTFQKLLAESGLPYQVVGDGSPYDQPQIQAIIKLMRAALSHEPIELEGYGSAERRYLAELLATAETAAPSALAAQIVQTLGIEQSLELQQFAAALVRFKDVKSALQYFDDIAENGFYDPLADAVTLLTIHAGKGLEFPQVFLIGAEEGILPSHRGEIDEEKRLFYVAATRAQDRLEIVHSRNRKSQKAEVSRFVSQLPADVLERHIDPGIDAQLRRIAKRAAKNSQTSLF